jgi:hypothetical protein
MTHTSFYADEDVNGLAIRIACSLGVRIVTSNEVGLSGSYDEEQFRYADEHGYVLVTGNIRHFAPMFKAWLAAGRDHPGIVFIHPRHHRNSKRIAEELHLLFEAGTPDDLKNQVYWI